LIPNSDKWRQKTFENADADNTSSQLLLIQRSGQLIAVFKDWIYWEEDDAYKEEIDEYEPERCSKTDNGENMIEQRRQK
jgi:hypothetical protein